MSGENCRSFWTFLSNLIRYAAYTKNQYYDTYYNLLLEVILLGIVIKYKLDFIEIEVKLLNWLYRFLKSMTDLLYLKNYISKFINRATMLSKIYEVVLIVFFNTAL